MQVYNVVKFKVKPGEEAAFLDAHRDGKAKWPGLERGLIIKTGEPDFLPHRYVVQSGSADRCAAGHDQDTRQLQVAARGSRAADAA